MFAWAFAKETGGVVAMSELTLWKNEQIEKFKRDIDQIFNRFWSDFGISLFAGEVSDGLFIKTTETEDTLVFKVVLPEVNPENLKVSVTNDTLTIQGKKEREDVEESMYYHRFAKKFDSFSRTVSLPCSVKPAGVRATYKNHVLTIVMPKLKHEKTRIIKIEIK